MNLRTAWRLARAETRRGWGRLFLCVLSVALGVFSLTFVRALSSSVSESLEGQAQQSMGADLTVSARQPLEKTRAEALTAELVQQGARFANVTRFYSMLTHTRGDNPAATQLIRVYAVGDGFPFYGSIETLPAERFAKLGESPTVIIDRQIAERLKVGPGDSVRVGELSATVAGLFIPRPGSPAAGFSLASPIYMHERFLKDTELIRTGSRIDYERAFALPSGFDADRWKKNRESEGDDDRVRITTAEEGSNNVRRFIDRLSGFMTVVAMVTLLLGALGIGSSLRAFMREKLDHAAIFRVIGVTPRGLFYIYALMALWVASLGCVLGAALGVIFPLALISVVQSLGQEFLPEGVGLNLQPSAALWGVTAGLFSTIAFTLWPIWQTALVSPLRVLRRDVETLNKKSMTLRIVWMCSLGVLVLGGFFLSAGAFRSVAAAFGLAVVVASCALHGLATVLTRCARWLAHRARSYAVRQGILNLYRPGNQTKSVVLALGLGVLLLCTMFTLQYSLQKAIAVDQRRELPNLFVIDIQTDQLREVRQVIQRAGATRVDESPMIAARVSAINSRKLTEQQTESGSETDNDRRRRRTREYFVSYRPHLIDSEAVTDGRFWSGTPARQEASIDAELAESLGIQIGDILTLSIQGIPLDAKVTSFREIHWQAVRPNSLILLSPGEIEQAPQQHVVSFRVANEQRSLTQSKLVERFPNLTVIDVTEATRTVKLIIERVASVFQGLGSLAVFAGLLILTGAVASGRYARQHESTLLKVLGARRATLRKILITEQVALSGLGASAGWLLSEVLSRILWPFFFEVPVVVPYALIVPFLAFTVLLSVALGALTSRRVSERPALELLREQ